MEDVRWMSIEQKCDRPRQNPICCFCHFLLWISGPAVPRDDSVTSACTGASRVLGSDFLLSYRCLNWPNVFTRDGWCHFSDKPAQITEPHVASGYSSALQKEAGEKISE